MGCDSQFNQAIQAPPEIPQDVPAPQPLAPPEPSKGASKNVPLTLEQKLTVMTIQRKMFSRRLQSADLLKEADNLEKQMQAVLSSILQKNNIDFTTQMLDEDLNVVPLSQK